MSQCRFCKATATHLIEGNLLFECTEKAVLRSSKFPLYCEDCARAWVYGWTLNQDLKEILWSKERSDGEA